MTTYNYSNNPNVVFNPNTDVLFVDVGSAADLFVSQNGTSIVFVGSGHTAVLQGVSPGQLTTGNVAFGNGSVMLVGDNIVSTSGDGLDNDLRGGNGNDLLIGLGGNDALNGGGGNDRVYGNTGNDDFTLSFGPGEGRDTIFGGQGNDAVHYALGADNHLVYGNLGNDSIETGSGSDVIFGGQGNDFIGAGNGNNILHGNLGDDTLFGGTGNDTIFGENGNDSISSGIGRNLIYGNAGNDTIGGSFGSDFDTAFGGQGDDLISYINSNSVAIIYGNLGNDVLIGSNDTAPDLIFGGQGDDLLRGRLGGDVMSGGLGNDTFLITRASGSNDSGRTSVAADDVTDFVSGQDKVRVLLSGTGVAGTASNYNEFAASSVGTVEQAAQAYEASLTFKTYTFIAGSTDGFLVIDETADGIADSVVTLLARNSLSNFALSDIIG